MARKTYTGDDTEDIGALQKAWDDALIESFDEPVTAIDLLKAFMGDRNAIARMLAGLPASGKLPARGTEARARYETQYKNLDRWLRYEAGDRGKQARSIEKSQATQNKVRGVYGHKAPPVGAVGASITGWIGYPGDWRYRTIDIPAIGKSVNTRAFNEAMQSGDLGAAYRALFDAYAPALSVVQADQFNITYSE